jgi:transposase-like protein
MVSMRKSRLSQTKQNRLMEHFVTGATAGCSAALVGVNSKTSVYNFHRLRESIGYHLECETDSVVGGEIEVDEPYFGGRRKGERGRGAGGKVPKFGLLKRRARSTRRSFPTPRTQLYIQSKSARWCPTASSIRIAGAATMCWLYQTSSIAVSITRNSLQTSKTKSMASRTSGTGQSVICGNSMVFQRSNSGNF